MYDLLAVLFLVLSAHSAEIHVKDEDNLFKLSIIHFNDFHARFEPISVNAGACSEDENLQEECYGGIARLVTATKELQTKSTNPLTLFAGDSFQGTLLFSLFKWVITVEFLNRITIDVSTIGNHEFDNEIEGLLPYLSGLKSEIVVTNIDDSKEPSFQNKYVNSTTVTRDGVKIGIIGCISKYTGDMSSTGQLQFLDEVEPITQEVEKLRSQDVSVIILLSHSGYDVDQRLATEVPDLDVIVGAHTHTFLYTGEDPPSSEIPEGDYPTVITTSNGRRVLVVQAFAYSKYLGLLEVQFDSDGEVYDWTGNPILMDSSVQEDIETKEALKPWVKAADRLGNVYLGESLVLLDDSNCFNEECNLGNFLTDAMVDEQLILDPDETQGWTLASIGFMTPGGIRAPLGENRNITVNDLVTCQPFHNTVDTLEMQGKDLLELFELAASKKEYKSFRNMDNDKRGCIQVSGATLTYDMDRPEGSRLVEMMVRCADCKVPSYEAVDLEKWYPITTISFLSNGGDGYTLIPERSRNKVVGDFDVNVFARYIEKQSPITQGIERRIYFMHNRATALQISTVANILLPVLVATLAKLIA